MFTDPIADMLTRIRNAAAARKTELVLPYSKFKANLAQLLLKQGFIAGVNELSGQQSAVGYHCRPPSAYSASCRAASKSRMVWRA